MPDSVQNVTEYTEGTSQHLRLEAEFSVANARVGDRVEMKIYLDGVHQRTETREVSSANTSNFVDVLYTNAFPALAGTHTLRIAYNENRGVAESNYGNNEQSFTYTIKPEREAPTFSIRGPVLIDGQTCLTWENLQDNVSVYTDVWAKWKIDGGDWSDRRSGTTWGCTTGTPGSTHTYYVHAEDRNGNVREDTRVFAIQ